LDKLQIIVYLTVTVGLVIDDIGDMTRIRQLYTLILMKVYGRINKENTRSCTGRFKVTDHAA
jgi:hypothetical protein